MPGLLPIGRWVGDPKARAEVALAWNKATLPATPGRSTAALLAAAASGELGALVIAGVDPADLPDPAGALRALDRTPFIVSLELRASAVTDRADVVFPVAAVAEKAGTFVNWEGRGGTFAAALTVPGVRTDLYVLGAIADEMDVHLGLPDAAAARAELAALGAWQGARPAAPAVLVRAGRAAAGRPPGDDSGWRPGTSSSTRDGCRTASRTWPAPRGRWRRGSPRPPRPAAGLADGDKVTVVDRGRLGDRPAARHRHGRRRGVAAHQQPRLRGPRGPRRGPRQQGDPEEGRVNVPNRSRWTRR